MPKPGGYQQMDGEGAVPGGGMYEDNVPESPVSFEEIERPPLRHIGNLELYLSDQIENWTVLETSQ